MSLLEGSPFGEFVEVSSYPNEGSSCEKQSGETNDGESEDVENSAELLEEDSDGRAENPEATQHEAVVHPELVGVDEIFDGIH